MANHTYDVTKYAVSINNLGIIKEYLNNICVVDTIGLEYSDKLKEFYSKESKINNHFLIENNDFFDFGKWIYALNTINYYDYDYIVFINDSVVFDLDIKKYFEHIIYKLDRNINLFGYNDSTQVKFHYQSYLFTIHSRIVKNFIQFFESKKSLITSMETLIFNTELCLHEITQEHTSFVKISHTYNIGKNIHWENEDLYKNLLLLGCIGIYKLKRIFELQSRFKIKEYDKSILKDFDFDFYRNMYDDIDDIYNLTNDELFNHFIDIGQYEGRRYKEKIDTFLLPDYYRTKLHDARILYIFDLPDDFDLYYYKKNNYSIVEKDVKNIEYIFHYLKYGVFNKKSYKKTNVQNDYISNLYERFYDNSIDTIIQEDYYNSSIISESSNEENYLPDDFDVKIYRYLNNDLNEKTDDELINHYLQYGQNEGRVYKINFKELSEFETKYYKKYNEDLSGLSDNDLIMHFLKYGYNENRKYKYDIDLEKENKNKNNDKEIDKNKKNIFAFNKKNNKTNDKTNDKNEIIEDNNLENMIPSYFLPKLYLFLNPDLYELSDDKLLFHYLTNGIKEKRPYHLKLSKDFDINNYIEQNPELTKMSDIDIKIHYFKSLNKKNNIAKPILNQQNNDENNKNRKTNKILFGSKKKEVKYEEIKQEEVIIDKKIELKPKFKKNYYLPHDFNVDLYRRFNIDLNYLNNDELKEHYGTIGFYQNRYYKLPEDFNGDTYKSMNSDLYNLTKEQCIIHFISNGIYERRMHCIPSDFSPQLYKRLNVDLASLPDRDCIIHFIDYYLKEGRRFRLPPDFDVANYLRLNPDLKALNEEQLINHYLNNGINEDRLYK